MIKLGVPTNLYTSIGMIDVACCLTHIHEILLFMLSTRQQEVCGKPNRHSARPIPCKGVLHSIYTTTDVTAPYYKGNVYSNTNDGKQKKLCCGRPEMAALCITCVKFTQ